MQVPFRQFFVSTAIGLQPTNIILVHAGSSISHLHSWKDLCAPYLFAPSIYFHCWLQKDAFIGECKCHLQLGQVYMHIQEGAQGMLAFTSVSLSR
jgi:hypothetical protein